MGKIKLLMVDDEESILKSLCRTLADSNLDIYTASSGEQGLKILAEHKMDLIISDQRMPQMNGTQFLTEVRKMSPNIITMILTAYSDIDVAIKAINDIGVFKFIIKPWDETDLKLTIEKAKRLCDLMQTNTILKENMVDTCDKTVVANMIDKMEKKDPVLEQAAQDGMTDYGNIHENQNTITFDLCPQIAVGI